MSTRDMSNESVKNADIIYHNGTVITMDPSDRIAEAVAIKGDAIVGVGSADDMFNQFKGAIRIDLDGKTLAPGFIDSHSHFQPPGDLFAPDFSHPPVGTVTSIEDIIAKAAEKAREIPEGEWIQGMGFDGPKLREKRLPTRYDLDRASARHPIFLLTLYGHVAVANSLALELAGINADTPDPEGGHIGKDENGEPNGILEEMSAQSMVIRLIPPWTREQMLQRLKHAVKTYAEKGLTTANSAGVAFDHLISFIANMDEILAAADQGLLKIRLVINPAFVFGQENLDRLFQVEVGNHSDRLIMGAVKMIQDGSIQGYTAYLSEPYHVQREGESDYCGYPTTTREKLAAGIDVNHNLGRQIFTHGNGDAAIDDILHGYEMAHAKKQWDARHVVIHAQMTREDQLDKMKKLGAVPSFFVEHVYYFGDDHRDIYLGPERAAHISPCKSAVDRGMPFTIHSDAPVGDPSPLFIMWTAVNRVTHSGQVLGPEQRITPLEALRALTTHAAYQYHQEEKIGSIEPGKLADLVILSDNPLTVPPMKIKDIQVIETIVGGKTVFKQ
ncbi:MAG: amidohydrolase [Deltaproteobacteria bacterium]|nr:amidohydrolase [Deltaproteobacteria bacterium]